MADRIETGDSLEQSVRTLHSVMLRDARRLGLPWRHEKLHGYKASLNLAGTLRNLTPLMDPAMREHLARMCGQVLRRTGTAVCLHRADTANNRNPTWFIASELPENLVIVSSFVGGRSAAAASQAPGFSENSFLRYEEKKLRPEEVGEDRAPGEVTVKTTTTKRQLHLTEEQREARAQQAKEVFGDNHAESQRQHNELVEQVYEFVATAPVPMTHPELSQLFNVEFGTDWHATTMRQILVQLVNEGRLKRRPETREERLVRGGGRQPRARGPQIYQLFDDDTMRTTLPKGIEPMRASEDWAAEKRRRQDSIAEKIYRLMDVGRHHTRDGESAPRTLGVIARAAKVSEDDALQALRRLEKAGRVWHHPEQNYWSPMHRVRAATLARYASGTRQAAAQPILPGTTLTAEVPPAPQAPAGIQVAVPDSHVPADRQHLAGMIADMAHQLATVPDDNEEINRLKARVAILEVENNELRAFKERAQALFGN